MPRGSKKANEFKRYRQLLTALYLAIVSAGFALLAASVVNDLFFEPSDRSSRLRLEASEPGWPGKPSSHDTALRAGDPDHPDLALCHDEVADLYSEPGRQTAALLALPGADRGAEILPRWKDFARAWLKRWEEVATWCRFAEPAEPRLGEAHQAMAQVHGELPALLRAYQSLLVRFDEEQATELARLSRELERSRTLLSIPGRTPSEGEEAR